MKAFLVATVAVILSVWAPASAVETNSALKRVLILHSFGREFYPFSIMSAQFRTELARRSPTRVEFHEASIELARFEEAVNEEPVVDYLLTQFSERHLDLIVAMGGPADL